MINHSSCPVCHGAMTQRVWGVNSEQAAQHFVLREQFPERHEMLASHIRVLWGQDYCEVRRCEDCGFCFSAPYIAGDATFYGLAYERSGYPTWKWEYQVTLDVLKSASGRNLRLLEVGAGDGAFIRRVIDNVLPRESIFCTEYSDYGRRKIEKMGVRCVSEDIRELAEVDVGGAFDIVCMFQVLEHMDRLGELFEKLGTLVRPGGSLFIAVPNPVRIKFNEENGALLDMPPNHIGRWNKKCFEIMGDRSGFRLKEHMVEKDGLLAGVRQFLIYRFLRKSQVNGSFENRIQSMHTGYLHRLMQFVGLVGGSFSAIPYLGKEGFGSGDSLWVHLLRA